MVTSPMKKLFPIAAFALAAVGCAHEMTVSEFVNTHFMPDAKLQALNAAADAACQAYQFQSSTPAENMNDDFDHKIMSMVNTANDKWRLSKTVRLSQLSPAMSVAPKVRLMDMGRPEYYVPINGASCVVYRVRATPNQVTVVGTSTQGGVPIIALDPMLNATVEGEFAEYLGSDTVKIRGSAMKVLNRAGKAVTTSNVFAPSDTPQTKPAAAPAEPSPPPAPPIAAALAGQAAEHSPAGCAKDTDCKGDRVCVQGACVSPPTHAQARARR